MNTYIKSVKYLNRYQLEVVFMDNHKSIADFDFFLHKTDDPIIIKYRNIEKFKKVKINTGFLSWGNGEMEIPGNSIYTGNFNPVS